MGDFGAQVAACNVGEAGFLKLIDAYGLDAFTAHVEDLMDYSERLTRAELRSWPNGVYTRTDYIDDDGIHPEPIPICVTITIEDDQILVDFTGSSPQIPAALNCTPSFMKAGTYCALRSLMRADIPVNDGFFRPITATAPPGTITNCVLPAATATRGLTGFRIIDAIFGALSEALPDRVPAASDGGLTIVGVGGYNARREPFVLVELLSGSWGGRPDREGIEGMPNLAANISNIPVEMVETSYPLRIEQYGFVPDTGGAGTYRGGLSIFRDFRFLADATLSVRSDRHKFLPFGLHGGNDGTPASNVLNGVEMPSKFMREVSAGDLFHHVMAGGGGWGDPLDRDPQAILRDVREGRLSIELVLREYGVVIRPDLTLDDDATTAERARLRECRKAAPPLPRAGEGDGRRAHWRDRRQARPQSPDARRRAALSRPLSSLPRAASRLCSAAPSTTTSSSATSSGPSSSCRPGTPWSSRTAGAATTRMASGTPTSVRPPTATTPSSGSACSPGATAPSGRSASPTSGSPRSCRRRSAAPTSRA